MGKENIEDFFLEYQYFNDSEKQKIRSAWDFLNSKTELCSHPLRVAKILASNQLDCETIIAALLHEINETGTEDEQIRQQFGDAVFSIISTTNKILNLPINAKRIQQSDAIRKMFFALSDDIRVLLITLAERLDRIRNIKDYDADYQKILAEAVIEVWAPLADRLGMQNEKNEFEDLSLKYTNPAVFRQIKEIVSQSKEERTNYLEKAQQSIYKAAEKTGIKIEIQSRAKHFYSIYQKMRKRNKEAGELYDLFALRILCENSTDCYTLIGIVHGLWKPLDGRFKDYIAMPKTNGYQSLHTTVMCEGKPLEIQIRTFEMHMKAEHGIASHWLYKKGSVHDVVKESSLNIFNKLQSLKEQGFKNEENFATIKNELLGDEIYVFTPKGDVRKLPYGATAIDFAYSIHSAIGEKIIAAKADGKIIPLNKPLSNTQIIEIITNPNSHPTEAQLKIVKTTKAHQRIHSWLMANDPTFSERQMNEAEPETPQRQRKRRFKSTGHLENAVERKPKKVLIQGEKNVLYNLAQCCKPCYPDLIAGYVTRTKGVSIHKADCLVYQRIPYKEQRSVQVAWDKSDKD
ncbi:MAG: bifunctional (p)ppGpp synthetase/guanosine-3',5'-bis(diphosphate) 3'-pyrophosphohydrolase [Treponema sp.]|nr:bifunctional (p)ppGpp synthetase/guanosine-3',5'-bis(diphosphate) 3'-pyrophosphohydrolase [Treponema sp.]